MGRQLHAFHLIIDISMGSTPFPGKQINFFWASFPWNSHCQLSKMSLFPNSSGNSDNDGNPSWTHSGICLGSAAGTPGIPWRMLGGCLDPTGPLGCAGNWIKLTFPSLFPLLCSTLPDSPPDSGSEAYSPQQVNGKCFKKGEAGGKKKPLIQTPNPASTPSLFRESGWLCNLYQPGENRRLHYVGRLSVSKYPSAFAHCSAPACGKGERDRHRRRAGDPRTRNPWWESVGSGRSWW